MILNNKRGQVETGELVSLIFIMLILVLYMIFIVSGSVLSGEVKNVIKAKDDVLAYTYHTDLVNYLNTNVEYDLDEDGFKENVLMIDIFKEYFEEKKHEDFIEERTEEFLERISHCYYEGNKVKKVGFKLFLSNGKEWNNIPDYKEWKVDFLNMPHTESIIIIPKHLTEVSAYQKITEEDYVFLYREDGIRVGKEECDNLE